MKLLFFLLSLQTAMAQTTFDNPSVIPRKDPRTAFWLSFGSTVGMVALGSLVFNNEQKRGNGIGYEKSVYKPSIGILSLGLVVGPSIGHFYAGNDSGAIKQMLLRGLCASLFVLSLDYVSRDRKYSPEEGSLLIGVGLIGSFSVGVGDAITDILSAPKAARKHNNKIAVYPLYDMRTSQVLLGMTMQFQ